MTSKEALEILFASYNYNGNYQEVIEAREKLEQDLERLEKLEQENKSLKLTIKCQNASEEQMKLYALGLEKENKALIQNTDCCMWLECSKITQENQKLKKAIDILKDRIKFENLGEMQSGLVFRGYFEDCFYEEEYELLKEVLCDGN